MNPITIEKPTVQNKLHPLFRNITNQIIFGHIDEPDESHDCHQDMDDGCQFCTNKFNERK